MRRPSVGFHLGSEGVENNTYDFKSSRVVTRTCVESFYKPSVENLGEERVRLSAGEGDERALTIIIISLKVRPFPTASAIIVT